MKPMQHLHYYQTNTTKEVINIKYFKFKKQKQKTKQK